MQSLRWWLFMPFTIVLVAILAGLVHAPHGAFAQVITGCLGPDGTLSQVQVGISPASPCDDSAGPISWNREGTVGPRGEPGPPGPVGERRPEGPRGEAGSGKNTLVDIATIMSGLAAIAAIGFLVRQTLLYRRQLIEEAYRQAWSEISAQINEINSPALAKVDILPVDKLKSEIIWDFADDDKERRHQYQIMLLNQIDLIRIVFVNRCNLKKKEIEQIRTWAKESVNCQLVGREDCPSKDNRRGHQKRQGDGSRLGVC